MRRGGGRRRRGEDVKAVKGDGRQLHIFLAGIADGSKRKGGEDSSSSAMLSAFVHLAAFASFAYSIFWNLYLIQVGGTRNLNLKECLCLQFDFFFHP